MDGKGDRGGVYLSNIFEEVDSCCLCTVNLQKLFINNTKSLAPYKGNVSLVNRINCFKHQKSETCVHTSLKAELATDWCRFQSAPSAVIKFWPYISKASYCGTIEKKSQFWCLHIPLMTKMTHSLNILRKNNARWCTLLPLCPKSKKQGEHSRRWQRIDKYFYISYTLAMWIRYNMYQQRTDWPENFAS